MSTVTLKTGEVIESVVFENIWNKLTRLMHDKPPEFYRLVQACRHPDLEVKRCIWPAEKCRRENHVDCADITLYFKLIKSFDTQAHADIDPVVRAVVLAGTAGLMLPRLVSPLMD